MKLTINNQRREVKFGHLSTGATFVNGHNLYIKTAMGHARCLNVPSHDAIPFSVTTPVQEVESIEVTLK